LYSPESIGVTSSTLSVDLTLRVVFVLDAALHDLAATVHLLQ